MAVLHPSFHVVIQVSCNPPKSIVRSGGKIRVIFVSWGGGFDFPIFFGGDCCCCYQATFFFRHWTSSGNVQGGFSENRRNAVCVLHESVQPCSGGLLCGVPYAWVSFRLERYLTFRWDF